MGDDYTGPVTVQAEDGSERVLADINVWRQSDVITEMVKDNEPGEITIPLTTIPKEALYKVLEYMEKMAAFKADRASDEDKQRWVSEYKKTMEAQDQLPLLFQTMTGANFMNVKTLLDELCKFVAEMIAQRTPNEILDYFNIRKDACVQEEMKLMRDYKWIDPEGLIKEDLYDQATQINEGVRPGTDDEMMRIINKSRKLDPEKCAAAAEARMGLGGSAVAGAPRQDD